MIYLLGDIGHYNTEFKILLDLIKKKLKKEDILVLLGDNFYSQGVKSIYDPKWNIFKQFFNINNKIYSILGNHDYQFNPYAQIEFKHRTYSMENWYYKKTIDDIDFFFIDTTQLITLGNIEGPSPYGNITEKFLSTIHHKDIQTLIREQLSWLIKSLKSSTNIKIVIGHYPIITYGHHYGGETNNLRKILFPVFKRFNVRAYISGHDHNVQHIILEDNKNSRYKLHNIIGGSSSSLSHNNKSFNKNYFYSKTNCILRLDTTNLIIEALDKNGVVKTIKL